MFCYFTSCYPVSDSVWVTLVVILIVVSQRRVTYNYWVYLVIVVCAVDMWMEIIMFCSVFKQLVLQSIVFLILLNI